VTPSIPSLALGSPYLVSLCISWVFTCQSPGGHCLFRVSWVSVSLPHPPLSGYVCMRIGACRGGHLPYPLIVICWSIRPGCPTYFCYDLVMITLVLTLASYSGVKARLSDSVIHLGRQESCFRLWLGMKWRTEVY
jgi:hypothetical protein